MPCLNRCNSANQRYNRLYQLTKCYTRAKHDTGFTMIPIATVITHIDSIPSIGILHHQQVYCQPLIGAIDNDTMILWLLNCL